jgi:phage tail P2-like protein
VSRYFASLPAWLRRDPALGRVLLAFERILDGQGDLPEGTPEPDAPALATLVDRLPACFRPGPGEGDERRAPAEFVPWLATWVAVGLRDEWDDETRRRVVAGAMQLYRLRGTREGLRRMIGVYVGLLDSVVIHEFSNIPHFFQVEVTLPTRDPKALARTDRSVRAIIDQEKPAHTFYGLRFAFPSMQIVDHPTRDRPGVLVGVNTLLGSKFSG